MWNQFVSWQLVLDIFQRMILNSLFNVGENSVDSVNCCSLSDGESLFHDSSWKRHMWKSLSWKACAFFPLHINRRFQYLHGTFLTYLVACDCSLYEALVCGPLCGASTSQPPVWTSWTNNFLMICSFIMPSPKAVHNNLIACDEFKLVQQISPYYHLQKFHLEHCFQRKLQPQQT